MVIVNACSSFPASKWKRVCLLFMILCAASVIGKTPYSLQSLEHEEGTTISSEFEAMMSSENCTDELKNKCRTEFVGNNCTMDENTYFNCTCNAVGFEPVKNGTSCLQVNCTSDDYSKCRTDICDNFCVYNGFVSQCKCDADGFIETNRRTECSRSYCTKKEEKMCLTDYDNDCIIANDKHECLCYGIFEETNNGAHCKRFNCTEDEAALCHSEFSKNKCYLKEGEEPTCYCGDDRFIIKDNATRCQRVKCSYNERDGCGIRNDGNYCTFTDDDYECQCGHEYFKLSADKKVCYDKNCVSKFKNACQSWNTKNSCNRTDVNKYVCICDAPFYVLSNDSRSCLQVECTKEEKKNCDPFDDGNSCYIEKGRIARCNCTSPNSVFNPAVSKDQCLSKVCRDFEDKFACKADIDGNKCAFPDGNKRECTCNAPGYTLVSLHIGRSNSTCWRNECTSYEEDACQTLITGNTCRVVDDVHNCTCNAPGYEAWAPKMQRCLNEWDIGRRTTRRHIDE